MSKLTDGAMDGAVLLKYLPALYQEDEGSKEFLKSFLSIFGSRLQKYEDLISEVPNIIDPLSTHDEFLPWLAGWIALDLYEWRDERIREFITNAVELYKLKGTARGLKVLAEMLTGGSCSIEEGEAKKNIFRTYTTASDKEKISRTVHRKNLQSMGTLMDEVHYIKGTNLWTIVGIHVLFEGNDEFEYYREHSSHVQRIIESFLPVFVRAEIYIRIQETPRRSHPTNLIEEHWKDITTK